MSLKKAWYGLLGRELVETTPIKAKDPRQNHVFDEEDTKHAVEMRRLRQDTARMRQKMELLEQKRELRELQEELSDDESEETDGLGDTDKMLMSILLPMLNKQPSQGAGLKPNEIAAAPPTPQQTVLSQSISDDEIRTALKQIPKPQLKLAKSLPKDIVYRKVTQQMPLTNEEFERAYNILVGEF